MNFPMDYEQDVDGLVWENELGPWLPKQIFDFHSHIFRRIDAPYAQKAATNPSMPVVCSEYTGDDYLRAMQQLFPDRELHALLFNTIDVLADLSQQNAYISETVRQLQLYGLMCSGLMDNEEEIETAVRKGGFLGLKPYWSYVTWKDQADVTLEDMLPPAQRKVADRLGLILMVHIPRLERLADPVNVEGMIRLCEECPNAKIILAHFGRSYFPEAIGNLSNLPSYQNLHVDFSMVQDRDVCQIMIETFGPQRILFGLDMPVAQEKGKLISVNGQRHFFTKRVHPWSINNSAGSYRIKCTYYAYEIIRAFKQAAEHVGLSREDIEAVFFGNAQRLVNEVQAGL